MNKSGFFFLLFAIVIAVGFTWLNATWLSYKGFVIDRQDKQVDYYLTDFTVLHTYPDGTMQYLVRGQHLVHQQSTGASNIVQPQLQARDVDNALITIHANSAIQAQKEGNIVLQGSVDVTKKSNTPAENFKLVTRDLSYNPKDQEISTQAKLQFTSPSGELTGQGFSTKLDEQELRIHNHVHAKFIPSQ